MFYGCENIKNINLYSFNTIGCLDMSKMFEKCKQLEYIDLSSFKINNKINMKNIFLDCEKLNEDLIKRVECKGLQELDLNGKLRDIKVLEKVDFKQLQQLNLNRNEISDIKVL